VTAALADSVGEEVGEGDGDVVAVVFKAGWPQALITARSNSAETERPLFTAGRIVGHPSAL